MAVYTLPFTVTTEGVTPAEVQAAGVFGDHLATLLEFTVPPEPRDCRYRLEITDGSGAYDISELLDAQNGVVRYAVPRKWTAAGTASVRLIAVKTDQNGEEALCFHAAPARLFFEERDSGEELPDILPAWQQVMTRAENLTEAVHNAMLSGELDGPQGPQGERGEKGEKGNPGAVSYETLTPEQKKELTAEGTALCAAVAAGVTTIEQNNNTPLKFWVGTQDEYDAIETKEEGTFYIVSDDKTLETLVAKLDNCNAEITQLKTRLNEGLITVSNEILAESAIQERFKKMPDKTFARYCVSIDGSYAFYELYKAVNGWGHMERIHYASRFYREVQGKQQGATAVTYTFGTWHQFAPVES